MLQNSENIQKNSFVEAGQDGIVRLLNCETSSNIGGIFTQGLGTCIAILIKGEHGITIIHDAGWISCDSIIREFTLIGNVEFWTIAFNPLMYPQKDQDEKLLQRMAKFNHAVEKIAPARYLKQPDSGSMKMYETSGFVAINREGVISINKKSVTHVLAPPHLKQRTMINQLNNLFCNEGETVPGDLQFDGTRFSECAEWIMPFDKMVDIFIKKTDANAIFICTMKDYAKLYDPTQLAKMDAAEEKKSTQLQATTAKFFTHNQNILWKNYSEPRLSSKYFAHRALFFALPPEDAEQAIPFAASLRKEGFDAELKKANNASLVVVDITTSQPRP